MCIKSAILRTLARFGPDRPTAAAVLAGILVLSLAGWATICIASEAKTSTSAPATTPNIVTIIDLPQAKTTGPLSLEQALTQRRSRRDFAPAGLNRQQLAQLCWAADGITDRARGFRTAPSAGALYPMELLLATAEGLYRYLPSRHILKLLQAGDLRSDISRQAHNQELITTAAVVFIIVAEPQRSARKYGKRSWRYCLLEAGHIGQNLLLQATAMSLASVPVGAFDDAGLAQLLDLPTGRKPTYLICVGQPGRSSPKRSN